MELIERYLASVRRNLPRDRAEDIAAELADALQSRREDREEALGRPLTAVEASAMLREFGHPLVVAARYRQHQYLIGPDTFPFYISVMKVVVVTAIALMIGLGTLSLMLDADHPLRTVGQTVHALWLLLLLAIGVVTIVFALLERHGFPASHLRQWKPEMLPPTTDRPRSQWSSAFEIGLGFAFLLWWAGLVTVPAMAPHGAVLIAAAPVWEAFYLPILGLICAQLAVNVMKWVRPRWTRLASVLTILLGIITLAIIAGLHRAGVWVVAAPGSADPAGAASVAKSVNLAIRIGFVAIAAVTLFQLLGEAWKLVRARGRRRG